MDLQTIRDVSVKYFIELLKAQLTFFEKNRVYEIRNIYRENHLF